MEGTKLESEILEAIQKTVTFENKNKIKKYFEQITVNDLIDDVFEE